MEDKIQEPQKIYRLDLEKYGLSHLKDKNILTLSGSDLDELLNALADDDISLDVPIPCTPYNVEGVLSYSECRRCGKCCIIFNPKKQKWELCHYNEPLNNHKCSIYSHRLGRYVGYGHVCVERKNTPFDYPDCPKNEGKPLHPAYNTSFSWCIKRRTD